MHKLRLDLVKESEPAVAAVDAEDEVYEEIEAPKFVDLTLPDHSRPDDGSWFCARVGCDQTHDVVDPDALHRSFRLRIMAARSPNVQRHRKALERVIPRPVGLITMISVPEKRAKAKLQDHPISSLRSTPSRAKARVQHCTTKVALTTPTNRKCQTNQEGFRSVRHQREPVSVVKDRIVAKVLFADTDTCNNTKEKPAKTTQSKCNSSVSEVSADTKKLKVGGRTRSVPSRYLCTSTTPKILKKDEESARSFKKAKETKKSVKFKSEAPLKLCDPSKLPETNRDKSNYMEVDGELRSQSATDTMIEDRLSLAVTSAGNCSLTLDSMQSAGVESKNLNNLRTVDDFQKETEPEISLHDASCIPDIQGQKEEIVIELDDDDKENASVASEERVMNSNSENHENENMKSVARENVPRKTLLPSQIKPSADRGRHKRTTNPRPFKLRVDERQILKEAHQRIRLQTEAQAEKANEHKLRRGERTKAVTVQEKTPQKIKPLEASKKAPLKDRSVLTPKKLPDPQIGKEHSTKSPASSLKRIRPVTVPKEPNFHRLHLPRDCSKRAAGEVQSTDELQ